VGYNPVDCRSSTVAIVVHHCIDKQSFSLSHGEYGMDMGRHLCVSLLGDDNRNRKSQSVQQSFPDTNNRQVVTLSGMYLNLSDVVQTARPSFHSSFFDNLFDFCFL
jgi:hypothetical protein